MKKDTYHHGNLKQDLIQAGIRMIDEEGFANLSIRKAAAMCGVSHAAPKSHFKNREEFEAAIKDYVTRKFTSYLEEVIEKNTDRKILIRDLGRAYVQFFHDNPQCYSLIFSQNEINIRMSKERIDDSNYAPFQLFQVHVSKLLREDGFPELEIPKMILRLWSTVNGLASISVMKGFHYEGDWMDMIGQIVY